MSERVVLEAPPMNRWALAGLVVAGVAAAAGIILVPVVGDRVGLSVGVMIGALGVFEAAAGLAVVVCLEHLHLDDVEVERY